MPVASIDVSCTEGVARVSFNPPILGELIMKTLDQFSGLDFEDLRSRLRSAAESWGVTVEVQLMASSK